MLKLGSIIALVLAVFGALRVTLSFFFAFGVTAEDNAAVARKHLAAADTGEAINEGMVMFVDGGVIGFLVKIAKNNTSSNET